VVDVVCPDDVEARLKKAEVHSAASGE
jgi:hypothetical protein